MDVEATVMSCHPEEVATAVLALETIRLPGLDDPAVYRATITCPVGAVPQFTPMLCSVPDALIVIGNP